jgi:hypothetical protein
VGEWASGRKGGINKERERERWKDRIVDFRGFCGRSCGRKVSSLIQINRLCIAAISRSGDLTLSPTKTNEMAARAFQYHLARISLSLSLLRLYNANDTR